MNMGVHADGWNLKRLGQHQIGGLSTDPRQRHQLLDGLWNLTAKVSKQGLGTQTNVLCFRSVETHRIDQLFDGAGVEFREVLGTRQSGLPGFILADLLQDQDILLKARQAAQDVIAMPNYLVEHPYLADMIIQKTDETMAVLRAC